MIRRLFYRFNRWFDRFLCDESTWERIYEPKEYR
jgi:hypothetical protein